MSEQAPIAGTCDQGFRGVRDAFAENFASRGEIGAAVCVIVDGRVVVDLHGGFLDARRSEPWQPDTLVDVYSVGKAIVGCLLLQLVDAGRVDLDDPIASVWPEFAQGAKESATVRHALTHQAGVPAILEPLTNEDLWSWTRMTDALAATPAWWEPGSRITYHTNTYGHLVGELVRRLTDEMPGTRLRAVAAPLEADFFFGLSAADQRRCAEVSFHAGEPDVRRATIDALVGDERVTMLSYFNPAGYSSLGVVNSTEWRSAQIPSTNGHATALGVARLYAAIGEPGRLLSGDLLEEATRPQAVGYCPTLGEEVTFGLGFKPTVPRRPFGPNPDSFGHFGTGGSVGFADPHANLAFGYVMNDVIPRWQSTRNQALIDATYEAL